MKNTVWAIILLAILAGCGGNPRASPAESGEPPAVLTEAVTGFTDIDSHPQEAYILEGWERGFYGVPADGRFRPDEAATMGEFTAALWNLAGQPGAGAETAGGAEAAGEVERALAWAREAGYEPPDAPEPGENATRLAAMELLYAYNGGNGGAEAMFTRLYDDGFEDSADIPPEGKAALYWGFYNVLIRETERYVIAPSGTVSRGDMAEILVRYADDFQSGQPEKQKEESMK